MFEFFNKVIEECGIAGIIMIAVAGLLYFLINRSDKRQEKNLETMSENLATSIASQNKTLIDTLSISNNKMQDNLLQMLTNTLVNRDYEKRETHEMSMKHRLDISEKMQNKLYDILNMYHCNRTGVLEFHNSKENLNGLSFLWYDLQYEQKRRNVSSISTLCKDMQISNLVPVISKVINHEGTYIYRIEDLTELEKSSPVLYDQLEKDLDVTNIIYAGLYNEDNAIIGLLFLEYTDQCPLIESIIDIHDIKERATAISELLEFKRV